MFKFIRDALSEFEHVVWPTPTETKKYMYYNVVVIVTLAIFLMVLGYLVQQSLVFTRSQFPHDPVSTSSSSELATQSEVDAIAESLQKSIQTGATQTGTASTIVLTGGTVTQ
jgi:preprotein translocase SecE subunit